MYISKIPAYNIAQNYSKNTKYTTNYGLRMEAPLNRDVVYFKGTPKFNKKAGGIPLGTAKKISKEMEAQIKDVKQLINDLFGDLVATVKKPKNPIYKISGRAKTGLSIKQKDQTRNFGNVKEIQTGMTDLLGVKVEMRSGDKRDVDTMLDRLIPAIRSHTVELIEIENKRPIAVKGLPESKACKYDYGTIDMMKKLIDVQEEVWNKGSKAKNKKLVSQKLEDDYTDANYSAIHILLKKPGKNSKVFELQIMGKDVAAAKAVDDPIWKLLNNKDLGEEYKPLEKIIEPYAKTNAAFEEFKQQMLEENPTLEPDSVTLRTAMQKTKDEDFKNDLKKLILFNEYRKKVFLFQRTKEPTAYTTKELRTKFYPLEYDIDPRLDFNYLYDVVQKCYNNAQKNNKVAKNVFENLF